MSLRVTFAGHVPISYYLADREVQRILLELLNQMDGFDQNVNVKVNINLLRG
jgi:ATP-dependent 26S proteasome regulatory subunit